MRLVWLTLPAIIAVLARGVVAELLRPPPHSSAVAPAVRHPAPLTALDPLRVHRALGLAAVEKRPPTAAPNVRLLGTLEAREAERSLASVERLESRRAVTLELGSQLDRWTVVEIGRGKVVLSLDDERLELGASRSAPGAAPSGIAAIGNRRTLPRAELEQTAARMAPIVARTTRVTPVFSDRAGAVTGFQLAFPPDSPLTQLGLQPNDVVRRINGQPVTMQLALDLAARWTTLSHLELGVDRDGASTTLSFDAI